MLLQNVPCHPCDVNIGERDELDADTSVENCIIAC